MALAILIDEFDGNPTELYELIHDEVKKREMPGVKFFSSNERRSTGWFSAGESAPMLVIADDTHKVNVLAYQYGRTFHVSTRAYWQKLKMADKERQGKLVFLEEVRSGVVGETVDRAVKAAL